MADSPEGDFKTLFVDMLIAWNDLENYARLLTACLAGLDGHEGSALTAHIPNVTLVNTMKALSELYDSDCISHVSHFSEGFLRLLSWRNYYVHGISEVIESDGSVFARIAEMDTKTGKLSIVRRDISRQDLWDGYACINRFNYYSGPIIGHIFASRGIHVFDYEPLSSLQKPALPGRLERSRQNLLSVPRLPQP